MSKPWPPRPIPAVPGEIQEAAIDGNLVIFVGAGVSRLMGCPAWSDLANAALKQLAMKELISFGDIQLLSHLDARKRLSIALQVAETMPGSMDVASLIVPERANDSKIYSYLNSIGCIYVTTNYDSFLDLAPSKPKSAEADDGDASGGEKPELICRPHQLKSHLLRELGAVIHLHGSVEEPESMIMTTPQYLKHYSDGQVQDFLLDLFERHTVLFLGYGLDEMEILEHILRKGGDKADRPRRRMYMLSGFYSHQEKTFSHLYDYYEKSFDVRLVPFNLDKLDHAQMEEVVMDWASRLEIGDPLLTDDLAFVMDVANE